MRIGIDIRDLEIARTGAKTYLEEICRAFPEAVHQHELITLRPRHHPISGKSAIKKILGHIQFLWWKEFELPWQARINNCDILLCTDYFIPLVAPCPTIPVFYDASFWERPEDYNRIWRIILNTLALPAAKRAPAVITISEFSKQCIARATGISLAKIKAIHIAPKKITASPISKEKSLEILKKHRIDNKIPFILHVGVIEKRKNLSSLIHAFAKAIPKIGNDYLLVLVGQKGPKQDMDDSKAVEEAIRIHNLEDKVILTGYVPDEELPAFYQHASLYAFPSLREGFGMPALEAFANGLPLIASNTTSFPEVVGDAALLFNPSSIDEISNAIETILLDPSLRSIMIQKGYNRVANFTWRKTVWDICHIFEMISNKKKYD